MTRRIKCETCIYCGVYGTGDRDRFLCQRFPPTIPSMFPGGMPQFPEVEATDWCGEYKSSPEKKSRTTAPNESTLNLVGHYMREFKRVFGAEPQVQAKDRAAAKTMAQAHSEEQAKMIITEFLEHPPQWHKERNLLDLRFIPSAANSILARGKGIAVDDTMSFLKTQADHRHEDNWFEYVDYVKKSGQKKTFEEWNNG